MSVEKLRISCAEIHKTINKLNPEFTDNICQVKQNNRLVRENYKLNFEISEQNQVIFDGKGFKVHEPKIWNSLLFISNDLEI